MPAPSPTAPARPIRFLNVDLDVVSRRSLDALTRALVASNLFALHEGSGALERQTYETQRSFRRAESTLRALLSAVEGLQGAALRAWRSASRRELNLGYECGSEPWAFNDAISADTLQRMAALGVTMRVTLYPAESTGKTARRQR